MCGLHKGQETAFSDSGRLALPTAENIRKSRFGKELGFRFGKLARAIAVLHLNGRNVKGKLIRFDRLFSIRKIGGPDFCEGRTSSHELIHQLSKANGLDVSSFFRSHYGANSGKNSSTGDQPTD